MLLHFKFILSTVLHESPIKVPFMSSQFGFKPRRDVEYTCHKHLLSYTTYEVTFEKQQQQQL